MKRSLSGKQFVGFVDEQVIPSIEEWNQECKFPFHLVKPMGELGFLGAGLSDYGGSDMNSVQYGLMMQELERGDSSLRSFVSVQSALVIYPILTYGSEEQKTRWLPRLCSGEVIGCFGLTEPDFGSNPAGMRTRAVKDGDYYILSGEKTWITSGSIADLALIWARLDDSKKTVRGFLVEKGTPGFSVQDIHGKYSMRASISSSLSLSDARVPAANMLPKVKGMMGPLSCLTQGRYGIGWGTIGAAMACFHETLEFTKTRRQFGGKPIAGHQLVQEQLVEMVAEISKGQLLALHLGRLKDKGMLEPAHASLLKRNNSRMALQVARAARDLLGASGITSEHSVFRRMANLESVATYEGTHNIHTLIVGQKITGIPAYE